MLVAWNGAGQPVNRTGKARATIHGNGTHTRALFSVLFSVKPLHLWVGYALPIPVLLGPAVAAIHSPTCEPAIALLAV